MCAHVAVGWHLHCVSVQGDRGFDGLPGLPGEKGHRVSPHRFSLTESFDAGNIVFRIPLMLKPLWKSHSNSNEYADFERVLMNNRVFFGLKINSFGGPKVESHVWDPSFNTDLQRPFCFLALESTIGHLQKSLDTDPDADGFTLLIREKPCASLADSKGYSVHRDGRQGGL